jgi:hypothetical protein
MVGEKQDTVVFLKVDLEKNKDMCKTLGIKASCYNGKLSGPAHPRNLCIFSGQGANLQVMALRPARVLDVSTSDLDLFL